MATLNLPGTARGSGFSLTRSTRASIPGSLLIRAHCDQPPIQARMMPSPDQAEYFHTQPSKNLQISRGSSAGDVGLGWSSPADMELAGFFLEGGIPMPRMVSG